MRVRVCVLCFVLVFVFREGDVGEDFAFCLSFFAASILPPSPTICVPVCRLPICLQQSVRQSSACFSVCIQLYLTHRSVVGWLLQFV